MGDGANLMVVFHGIKVEDGDGALSLDLLNTKAVRLPFIHCCSFSWLTSMKNSETSAKFV